MEKKINIVHNKTVENVENSIIYWYYYVLIVEKFVENLWITFFCIFPIFFSTILEYYNGNFNLLSGEMVALNVDILWTNVLNEIKDELSSLAFNTWFNSVYLKTLKDGVAVIIVPMSIHKKHLADNYTELIQTALNKVTGTNFELEFLLPNEVTEQEEKIIQKEEKEVGVPKAYKEKSNLNS